MTYREAIADFKANVLPGIPSHDKPAKIQAWSMYVDWLNRDGQITDEQAQGWDNPFFSEEKEPKVDLQYFSLEYQDKIRKNRARPT